MEMTTVLSEDLLPYSPSKCNENNRSKKTVGPRKSWLSNKYNYESRQQGSLKKISPSEENLTSAKNVKSTLNLVEKRKLPVKSNAKEVAKKNLTISTEKVKLSNRPPFRTRSSSINSAALRNPTLCKVKELIHFPTSNKVNKAGNAPSYRGNQTMKVCSKRKTAVEIEVFMPIIDVENNTVIYPESRKPIMRLYSDKNAVLKSRENKRGNSYLNKKNKEGMETSFSYSKAKREINSSKKVSNSLRKDDVKITVKTSLGKHASSVKDLRNATETDVGNNKITYMRRSSIRQANTKVGNAKSNHEFPIDVKTTPMISETNSQKQKIDQNFPNLLKDINKLEKENVSSLENEVLQERTTNFQSPKDDGCPKISTRRNSSVDAKDSTCIPDKRLWLKISRMPSPLSCDSDEDDNVDLHPRAFVKVDHLSQSDHELDELVGKLHSQQTWKQNIRCSQKYPKPWNWSKYNQLYTDRISLERKESSFSSPGSLIKISSNENGWRRTIPNSSFSSECYPMKSKWRRNIKDDELTMDSWIERCKYLQSKQHYFQLSSQTNNWRPS